MKTAEVGPTVDLRALQARLLADGLIREQAEVKFTAYEPAFPRLPDDRRWNFRVSHQGEDILHVIVGAKVGQLHSRAAEFFKACPELACRPLRYGADENGLEYLCLEHFAGTSLDQAVQAGKFPATSWLAAVRQAQRILARTALPSTIADLSREVQQLCDSVCALPGFSDADAVLLRDQAQPLLMAGCSAEKLCLRWSNGDFIGRNLLINDRGEIRLIDYEFAARSHFGRADWLRLFQFSTPPKELSPTSVREFAQARKPWLQIFLWLHQLSHQQGAAPSEKQGKHVATAVSQLFKAVRNAAATGRPGRKPSFLIDALSTRQSQIEQQLEERTAWATSLDADLKKARAAHAEQARLVSERTAWAQKLNAQLKAAAEENKRLRTRLAGHHAAIEAGPPRSPVIAGPREILLHFHIFKNAGTTLDAALERNLGPAWMQIEGADPNEGMDWRKALNFIEAHPQARVLSSHTLRYPPPPQLRGIKFSPLVLVRHPIDRLASIYHFERKNAEGSHSETTRVAQAGSLADFVRFTLTQRPEIGCNTQTAFIGRSGNYDDPPTSTHLEAAKSAIGALAVPGVVERLDRYLAMLELDSSVLPPKADLAGPDENCNPERAPSLLARLRTIRAQLPPELWRELRERNRFDLDLWRHAHQLAKARFDNLPGAVGRLADFRRRKALANEAALQNKESVKQASRAQRTAARELSGNAAQIAVPRAYALLKETAEERLAWAQVLDKELRSTQASFGKLAKDFDERSAWAISLHAELQQARTALAEETKLVDERTVWAKALDADLERARAALTAQSQLVEERTTWAQALDAELEQARTALGEQSKLIEERTTWAITLDSDLNKARAALEEQAQLVEKSSAWGKSLAKELRSARANFVKLTKEHEQRTAWAKRLESDLQQAGATLAERTKIAAERTVWAQSLEVELGKARAALDEQVKLVEERTAWAKTLDNELQSARALLASQFKLVEERTAWAHALDAELQKTRAATPADRGPRLNELSASNRSLEAELEGAREGLVEQAKLMQEYAARAQTLDIELQSTQRNFAQLSKEHAERTAWALELDADLRRTRTLLDDQSKLVEERTAWAKELDTELQKARGVAIEREQLAQQSLGALALLRRDLVAKNVETKAHAGSLLDAELRVEAAEAEVRRLTATQIEARSQVNQLLRQSQLLRHTIANLEVARKTAEAEHLEQARELARYEARLLCRLAAKRPRSPALRLHP